MGTKDAPHARLHTEANASHIRVALKDDNLGLGAKRGSGQGEGQCTGLDAFQGLLGRLNGKTEVDLKKEQKSRDDRKRDTYAQHQWGSVRFVSGGLLVGDKTQNLADDEARRLPSLLLIESDGQAGIILHPNEVVEGDEETRVESTPANAAHETNSSRRVTGSNSLEAEGSDRLEPVSTGNSQAYDYNVFKYSVHNLAETQPLHAALETPRPKSSDPNKKQGKEERKQMKHERELRRAAKKSRLAQKVKQDTDEVAPVLPQADRMDGSLISPSLAQPHTAPPRSQSTVVGARHSVRQRYIQHKRMAMMDSKALNEASRMWIIWKYANANVMCRY